MWKQQPKSYSTVELNNVGISMHINNELLYEKMEKGKILKISFVHTLLESCKKDVLFKVQFD